MINKFISKNLLLLSSVAVLASCVPDSVDGDGNGLTPPAADASFTVTKTSENRFALKTNTSNYISSKWDIAGSGFAAGSNQENIFLPDAGTYTVGHQAIGQGGIVAGTSTQTITVQVSDPVAGNLVQGGGFNTPADISKWTVHTISASGAEWVFANGAATIVASANNQKAIYQPIQVVAGRKYSIDMKASATQGMTNSWFEVYVLSSIPAAGQDVGGKVYRNINTWSGCGTSAFSGLISQVGCSGAGEGKNDGVFTAQTTGTVYLTIKCGGGNVPGVKIDDVEFRGMP